MHCCFKEDAAERYQQCSTGHQHRPLSLAHLPTSARAKREETWDKSVVSQNILGKKSLATIAVVIKTTAI